MAWLGPGRPQVEGGSFKNGFGFGLWPGWVLEGPRLKGGRFKNSLGRAQGNRPWDAPGSLNRVKYDLGGPRGF